MLDGMIVYMAAFWFVLRGALAIALAIKLKGVSKDWFWGLIIGILSLIAGIYSFAHPMVMALATGILIGLYCVETGLDTIITGVTLRQIEKATPRIKS